MSNDITVRRNSPSATLTMGQRTLYVGGGIALAAAAIKPRPSVFLTLLAFAAGAYLTWRGVEGSDPVKAIIKDYEPDMRGY